MYRLGGSLLALLLLLSGGPVLLGQQKSQRDSVFRLIQAERAEQVTEFGIEIRRVVGHARFFHNDTHLLCDSAAWNVNARFIECFGNVQIIQENTYLKSEEMMYWIDESRAQFRGGRVELIDKEHNTLRTEKLTYITKDSTAIFDFGGSLKDKDGNVIESRKGTYDGKEGLFTFEDRVELYMDSIEIKTSNLRYYNETERAYFGKDTYVWKDDGFLRSDAGWYDRKEQRVQFSDHVFMFDPSYDAWADEVHFDRVTAAVDLYSNAQVTDTTNHSVFMGDHLQYLPATDSLPDRGVLADDPAIVYFGENERHEPDTVYARADTFYVFALPMYEISEEEVKAAAKRLEDMRYDALAKKRAEDAERRETERIQKMRDVGMLPPEWMEKAKQATADSLAALSRLDSLVTLGKVDSVLASAPELRASRTSVDSLLATVTGSLLTGKENAGSQAQRDTTPAVPDSTMIRQVMAWRDVKLFRKDVQVKCDSMVFNEIDSIARLYGSPVLWNEVRNQLTADEMQLMVKGGTLERGSMIDNAWLISEQDTLHYDQIKSTEMLGWFRDNQLYRFDALGGVSTIFYLTDEEVITTINVKESKTLTAAMKDNQAQRLLYTESVKSDVYPVGDLPPEKQRLKDFNWRGSERPASPEEITTRKVRESERDRYEGLLKPLYRETNKFFDNYMIDLFEAIDARKRAEAERKQHEKDSLLAVELARDSLANALLRMEALDSEADSTVSVADSLGMNAAGLDSLGVATAADSLAYGRGAVDSTGVEQPGERSVADSSAVSAQAVALTDKVVRPVEVKTGEEVEPASEQTVEKSAKLTRAEKRAIRRAERLARREARKAARERKRIERAARRLQRHVRMVETGDGE
ncbi:MAG: hypothetical protein K6G79_09935 [Bacteroidales bacterium]|nr:hypothetical protein [Bacteroidales bacterium]